MKFLLPIITLALLQAPASAVPIADAAAFNVDRQAAAGEDRFSWIKPREAGFNVDRQAAAGEDRFSWIKPREAGFNVDRQAAAGEDRFSWIKAREAEQN